MENSYSIQGYTIEGLSRLNNTRHEIRIEAKENTAESKPAIPKRTNKITNNKYTDEQKAEIIRLKKEEKMPRKLIAEKFGITVKAVEHILYDKPRYVIGTGTQLDESQLKWFIKHYKHTKNDDIVAKLNISHASLHRLARQHNLKKSKNFMRKTQLEAMAKAKESHEINGTYPPKGYEIPKSDIARFKKGEGIWTRVSKKRAKQMHQNSAESLKQRRAKEKRRVLYGLEQETKLKVVAQSKSKVCLRCNMKKKHGYVVDSRDSNIMYYTDDTKRSKIMEQHAVALGFEIRKK